MQGSSPTDNLQRVYATKAFGFRGPEWYLPAPNAELVVYLEAERLSKCHLLSDRFQFELTSQNLHFHRTSFTLLSLMPWPIPFLFEAFEVLPTSLLGFHKSNKTSRIVQPWASGDVFCSRLPDEGQDALCDLLSAFSHFSVTFSEGESVMLDFEGETNPVTCRFVHEPSFSGFLTKNGTLLIFDYTIHTRDYW
jgi:hypothetical protein